MLMLPDNIFPESSTLKASTMPPLSGKSAPLCHLRVGESHPRERAVEILYAGIHAGRAWSPRDAAVGRGWGIWGWRAVKVQRWEELEFQPAAKSGQSKSQPTPSPDKAGAPQTLGLRVPRAKAAKPKALILPDRAAWQGCSLSGEEASRAPGCRVSSPPPEYARP